MIITIGGAPGAGKTCVSKLLCEKLGYKHYYMGQIMRDLAKERGMSLNKFYSLIKKEPEVDREVDEYQRKLGETEDKLVVEGRTSFHFVPNSYKIFLDVDEDVGAQRIFEDLKKNSDRNEDIYRSVSEVKQSIQERVNNEIERYQNLYGINHLDKKNFDLVIDTSYITVEQVVNQILTYVQK
jgi:CMP/dCMP kinase